MKSYIIGIAGELNSGKDTLASMINYIVAVGATKASFQEWITNKISYDDKFKDRITHFADPMKDCLSIMYNIRRDYFDSRKHKDEFWYVLSERRFITEDEAVHSKYGRITNYIIENAVDSLNEAISDYKWNEYIPAIKLRTLMQYFGTEIGRKLLDDSLWIDATMGKAADIAERRRICIIPDVRFKNELDAIKSNFLYGGDIEVRREQNDEPKHDSETIDFRCTYPIQNNGTKLQLFYKAIGFVNGMLNR